MLSTDASAATREALYRRTIIVVVIAQVLGGAGIASGVTVGALLAEDMLGTTQLSGLPAALFTAGSAGAAMLVGRVSQRSGRRAGLAGGYAVGAVGGAAIVLAAALDSVVLLLGGLVLYGFGMAANLQARYAAADVVDAGRRGRAISTVLVATTAGAVVGPNLVDATGALADGVGIPSLAGPFVLATAAYAAAAGVLVAYLRPDPLLTARAWAAEAAVEDAQPQIAGAGPRRDHEGSVGLGAVAMIFSQVVMVAVMTMTPIHMRDHGHGLGATGMVIAIHIAFMYLPSPVTGVLVDRFGRRPVIAAGAVVLLLAGLVAAAAPVDSVAALALGLGLLGLGWNLGLIGGTAMVTDATPLASRARTQGAVDLTVALAGAAGGLSSGVIVASTSYAALSVAGGVLGLALLPLLLAHTAARPRVAA